MTSPKTPPAKKTTPKASAPATTPVETPASPKKGMGRATDITLSIIFLALNSLGMPVVVVIFPFLAFATDACSESTCNMGGFYAGAFIELLLPIVIWLATVVTVIVLLVRKRAGWLLALIGWIASVVAVLLGIAIVAVSVGWH